MAASKLTLMTEERAKEIIQHGDASTEDCKAADLFVKEYALNTLKIRIANLDESIRDYVFLMARCHF